MRPTTAASIAALLDIHVRPTLGPVKLAKLTGLDLSSLYGTLLVSGYRKGKTPRRAFTDVCQSDPSDRDARVRDAVRWGLLARNPADQVDPPRKTDHEMPTWSAAEVRSFLEFVADDRLAAMWVLLCTTGMRRGEVLGLRWEDVDLENGRLAEQRALVEVDGYELVRSEPKQREVVDRFDSILEPLQHWRSTDACSRRNACPEGLGAAQKACSPDPTAAH